jgi:hypothetical protein
MIQREGKECSLCRGTSLRRDHHCERPQRRCDQKAQTCPTHPAVGDAPRWMETALDKRGSYRPREGVHSKARD